MLHSFSTLHHSSTAMPAGALAHLTRLLPASREAWRGAVHTCRQIRHPKSRSTRGLSCTAAAQLDAARTLTDLDAPEGRNWAQQQQPSVAEEPASPQGPESPMDGIAGRQQQGGGQGRTGAFQKLPMVSPAKELLESALRRAARVGANKKLKNEAQKAKNRAARQLDTLLKELCVPLGKYVKEFPPPGRLHPFEHALLELTVGPGTYERVLGRVDALRRSTVQVGKAYAARCSKALNKKEAVALQEEGFERMEAIFSKGAAAVDELKEVAKTLRKLPVVDPELPTVALVGAPNVGKSSLVQLLSSGLPEVQNYPFTTRSIKMGHFYVDGRRHQVTDTPGLLNRPDEDRNAMERLTLASLQHLPTAVLFVADLTGECGTSVADQWRIRQDLRSKFEGKPWIDVLSKADMLEEEFDAADELAAQQVQHAGAGTEAPVAPPSQQQLAAAATAGAEASGSSGTGSSREPAHPASPSPSAAGAAIAAEAAAAARVAEVDHVSGGGNSAAPPAAMAAAAPEAAAAVAGLGLGAGGGVSTAVAFAAGLPGAQRVSSLTGGGIEELKGAMLCMLEEAQLAHREGVEGWWGEAQGEEGEGIDDLDELIFHDDEEHREHDAYMYD